VHAVTPTPLALAALSLAVTRLPAQRARADTVVVSGRPLVAHRYDPVGAQQCPSIILLSGDGGWELGVVYWAEALASDGHEVVGVDAAQLVKNAGALGLAGIVASWPALARLTRTAPVVLGYSRGATIGLALAGRAEPPPPVVLLGVDLEDHFNGPDVPSGLTSSARRPGDYLVDLRPLFEDRARTARVAIVHGILDRVAPYDTLRPWFDRLPEPRRITILPRSGHGFGDARTVLPAIRGALEWAAADRCR
jgi:pimeloyl-ACP methyl ester carboxylesterase